LIIVMQHIKYIQRIQPLEKTAGTGTHTPALKGGFQP
jgi:hypothetical protein